MSIDKPKLAARSVDLDALRILPVFLYPGATTAGTSIALPDYARPAAEILQALHLARAGVVHSACPASGAIYPADTTLATVIQTCRNLTIVETAPATGQIQLVDPNNVVLGDPTTDGDLLLLIVRKKP